MGSKTVWGLIENLAPAPMFLAPSIKLRRSGRVAVYFVMGNRDALIQQYPKRGIWAEIGVYRGDFSQKILEICEPSEFYLIDNWRFEIRDHNPFSDEAEN